MKNIRFKDDEKISEIYEKVNLAPFRNYVYNFDGLGTYCNYLDEYECAIDNRDDKIEQYKEVIDKAIEYIKENKDKVIAPYGDNEDTDYETCLDKDEIKKLLEILKGENNE